MLESSRWLFAPAPRPPPPPPFPPWPRFPPPPWPPLAPPLPPWRLFPPPCPTVAPFAGAPAFPDATATPWLASPVAGALAAAMRPAAVAPAPEAIPYFAYNFRRSPSLISGLNRRAPLGIFTTLLAQATGIETYAVIPGNSLTSGLSTSMVVL